MTRLAIILAAALALTGAGIWIHYNGRAQGYNLAIAERAAADRQAELERRGDDVKLQNMDRYDLCVAGLRGNGMPVDACEQLRGHGEE